MMWNKKGDEAASGWSTIVTWAIIIGIGVLLLIITVKTTDFGNVVWSKIKDINPFV